MLRVVDRWVAAGCRPVETAGARIAVRDMAVGNPARAILGRVLDAVDREDTGATEDLVGQLMAYAWSFELAGRLELAIAVYQSVIDHRGAASSDESACDAWLRRGFCLRTLSRFDEALAAYEQGRRIAQHLGDLERTLRSEIGRAVADINRGLLAEAARRLDSVAAQAQAASLPEVYSRAMHDRALIFGMQGDYAKAAVHLAFEVLQLTPNGSERDRGLLNVGEALRMAGLRDAARDAFLVLSCTAEARDMRWHALVRLMRIAADDGNRDAFDSYRNAVDPLQCPPELAMEYRLQIGYGLRALGDPLQSTVALHAAIAFATRYGLGRQAGEAERALGGASDVTETPDQQTLEALATVVEALRTMRESTVPG